MLIGKSLHHFEVVEKIGEGGMGTVYKARDTHLDRFVALKILPPEKISDPDRRRRFVQEAKAASALNHPNIVHIYDIFTAEGLEVIAMEYVSGRTLDDAIGPRGMKLGRALGYAAQVADALAKAHAAGIVHRDLKPSNVMITSDGVVKLLDFGLAKLIDIPATVDSSLPTKSARAATDEGIVVGTAAYMSPEQAQGLEVDARSDIFSFGAVLYEMVTGVQAFQRESPLATLAAILKEEPKPPVQIVETLPREVDRIITRCLRKERERRWQNMSDLGAVLGDLKEESDSGRLSSVTSAAPRPKPSRLPVAVATVLLLVIVTAAGVIGWLRTRQPSSPGSLEAIRFTTDPGLTVAPALTPDGKLVAYASDRSGEGNLDIWVQQVEGQQPIRRTFHEADDTTPSFSPDGSKIVFRSQREGGGVYIMDTLGGEPRRLIDGGYNPRFSPDGTLIVFTQTVGGSEAALAGGYKIFLVSASGGSPRAFQPGFTMTGLSPPYGGAALWSPDGTRVLFSGLRDAKPDSRGWWVAPLDGGDPVAMGIERYLDPEAAIRIPAAWVRDRLIVFQGTAADGVNLYSLPLSQEGSPSGPSTRLSSGGGMKINAAVADDGRLLFADLAWRPTFHRIRLDPTTQAGTGELEPVTRDQSVKMSPDLSKDGTDFVYNANVSIRGRRVEVRRLDLEKGTETIVFSTPNALGTNPCLSPDGSLVAYHDYAEGEGRAHVVGGAMAAGTQVCIGCRVFGFTTDAKQALVRYGQNKLVLQDLDTGRQTEMLSLVGGRIADAQLSPDDKWLTALTVEPEEGSNIIVVPVGTEPAAKERWIAVAHDPKYFESPRWIADGGVIAFVSEWDGHVCIWGRRLDPSTKTPTGDPFTVLHLHGYGRGMGTVPRGARSFAVGPDFIVLLLGEGTANLWMTKLPDGEK